MRVSSQDTKMVVRGALHARLALMPPLVLLVFSQLWPSQHAPLSVLPVPPLASPIRIVIDAGHGAPGNAGNWGCRCQREADETLVEARELARRLRLRGFSVLETRTETVGATYQARIAQIEQFHPQLVVSLHTDFRANRWGREIEVDRGLCRQDSMAAGFSVLWSDEGGDPIVWRRSSLGRTMSRELRAARFHAYSGDSYELMYRHDPEPGCFIDARPMRQRVYFLRASRRAPVVIVETHHALDPAEVARWSEGRTHDAFAAAIASAALKFVEGR